MNHDDLRIKGAALLETLEAANDTGRKDLLPELTAHLSDCRALGSACAFAACRA